MVPVLGVKVYELGLEMLGDILQILPATPIVYEAYRNPHTSKSSCPTDAVKIRLRIWVAITSLGDVLGRVSV